MDSSDGMDSCNGMDSSDGIDRSDGNKGWDGSDGSRCHFFLNTANTDLFTHINSAQCLLPEKKSQRYGGLHISSQIFVWLAIWASLYRVITLATKASK